MDVEYIEKSIASLQEKSEQTMVQTLYIMKLEFKDDEKELSEKLRWYLITVDDILHNPDLLSIEEKEEFLRLHLAYIKKYNSKQQ